MDVTIYNIGARHPYLTLWYCVLRRKHRSSVGSSSYRKTMPSAILLMMGSVRPWIQQYFSRSMVNDGMAFFVNSFRTQWNFIIFWCFLRLHSLDRFSWLLSAWQNVFLGDPECLDGLRLGIGLCCPVGRRHLRVY